MTQGTIFANMHSKVRDLTRWYISLLKNVDPYIQHEVNGVKLNSVYWLVAHLTWAENMLILKATGASPLDISWLDHYSLGCDGTLHTQQPDMKEILNLFKEVHELTQNHLQVITDELIEKPNLIGFGFGGDTTNRMMIQHCIRHEAMHTGHLSWLCKIHAIETV
ncbi:MAG: DinB family protein [Chitinophagales bacterium]|nr:DinB family protein [Chitinophagales bacterium]